MNITPAPPVSSRMYTPADYKVPNRVTEPDGTLFLSGLQHLAIKYGPLTEYLLAAPCGSVMLEDMDELRAAGNGVWKACSQTKQAIDVVVWDASKPEPTEHLSLPMERIGITTEVKALVEAIHAETEKSWSGLSSDLKLVHQGLAESRAGSKDSYFATMVFINGEIRPLGYNVLNNILKVAATQPQFDLQHLVVLYKVFASTPAEFVGYTGANFLWSTYQKIETLIHECVQGNSNEQEAREVFLAMISAFAKYVNLLNADNLHSFPWRHTVEYPIALDGASGKNGSGSSR
ncbi:hypothetical protein FE257_011332 [Aspergillus nanangensis]|uniref:Cucumopine synthase C-terminal helical bundle domain-containing protein n=1 Tax=Aspergillus nanangensis TaxID=2582783 RepID=A0AAD4CHG8_ASPNN|nr:hypothetical protein FE257_011332 [Aspergillus nanangensis]